jgi:PEP-CTERM motif
MSAGLAAVINSAYRWVVCGVQASVFHDGNSETKARANLPGLRRIGPSGMVAKGILMRVFSAARKKACKNLFESKGGTVNHKLTPKRRNCLLRLAVVLTMLGQGLYPAAAITYDVDQTIGFGSVTGTLQTDGATGVLKASDFTGWNLILNGPGASFNLTPSNSSALVIGNDVTATLTDLFFNFSGTSGDLLLFQGQLFSGNNYYCDATSNGTCFQGASVAPMSFSDPSFQNVPLAGDQIIGTVRETPLPDTWTLMLLGLAGLGFAAYRRKHNSAFAGGLTVE